MLTLQPFAIERPHPKMRDVLTAVAALTADDVEVGAIVQSRMVGGRITAYTYSLHESAPVVRPKTFVITAGSPSDAMLDLCMSHAQAAYSFISGEEYATSKALLATAVHITSKLARVHLCQLRQEVMIAIQDLDTRQAFDRR